MIDLTGKYGSDRGDLMDKALKDHGYWYKNTYELLADVGMIAKRVDDGDGLLLGMVVTKNGVQLHAEPYCSVDAANFLALRELGFVKDENVKEIEV